MAYKGIYTPKHPEKYVGDPNNIIFRSLWERKCMKEFDLNPAITAWASEEKPIPYFDPVKGKLRRYFPDFIVETKKQDGTVETIMIEVKPFAQTQKPNQKRKKTSRFMTEAATYITNEAKWKQATKYCEEKGWKFMILTEKEIFE